MGRLILVKKFKKQSKRIIFTKFPYYCAKEKFCLKVTPRGSGETFVSAVESVVEEGLVKKNFLFVNFHLAFANHKICFGPKYLFKWGERGEIIPFLEFQPSFHGFSTSIPNGLGYGLQAKLPLPVALPGTARATVDETQVLIEQTFACNSSPSTYNLALSKSFPSISEVSIGVSGSGLILDLKGFETTFGKLESSFNMTTEAGNLPGGVASTFALWRRTQSSALGKTEVPLLTEHLTDTLKETIRAELTEGLKEFKEQQVIDLKQAFVDYTENQPKNHSSLATELNVIKSVTESALDNLQKFQNQGNDGLQAKLNDLQELQKNHGSASAACCTKQLAELDNVSTNLENISKNLPESISDLTEKGILSGLQLFISPFIAVLTITNITVFIKDNAGFFICSYVAGGLLGVFYYKLLLTLNDPFIRKNPFLKKILTGLSVLFTAFSGCTLAVIGVNIIYNLVVNKPLLSKSFVLQNGFSFEKLAVSINSLTKQTNQKLKLISQFLLKNKFIVNSFQPIIVVVTTLTSVRWQNQNLAITFVTAVFAAVRLSHMTNPRFFFVECVSYFLFATKYNLIFRYMMFSNHCTKGYTKKQEFSIIVDQLLYPLPEFLPRVPVVIRKKLLFVSLWQFIFNRKQSMKLAYINNKKN